MNQHTKFNVGDKVFFNSELYGTIYEITFIDSDGDLRLKEYECCGFFDKEDFTLVETNVSWKIESDGTNSGTKVYINNVWIRGVQEVIFTAKMGDVPRITINIAGLDKKLKPGVV